MRSDEAVVQPQATGERAANVAAPERPDVELECAGLQVIVGELLEDGLGGKADGRYGGQQHHRQHASSDRPTACPLYRLSTSVRHWSPGSRS